LDNENQTPVYLSIGAKNIYDHHQDPCTNMPRSQTQLGYSKSTSSLASLRDKKELSPRSRPRLQQAQVTTRTWIIKVKLWFNLP
jgi:hypothetical protein